MAGLGSSVDELENKFKEQKQSTIIIKVYILRRLQCPPYIALLLLLIYILIDPTRTNK